MVCIVILGNRYFKLGSTDFIVIGHLSRRCGGSLPSSPISGPWRPPMSTAGAAQSKGAAHIAGKERGQEGASGQERRRQEGGGVQGAGRTEVSKHEWSCLESGTCPCPREDCVKEKPRSQGVERRWEEVKRCFLQGPYMINTNDSILLLGTPSCRLW